MRTLFVEARRDLTVRHTSLEKTQGRTKAWSSPYKAAMHARDNLQLHAQVACKSV